MKFLRVLGNRAVLFVLLTIAVAAGVYMVLALAQGASVTCTANAAATLTTCRSTNGAGIDEDGDGLVDEDPLDGVNNDGDGSTDEDPSGGDEGDTSIPIDAVTPRTAGLPTVFTANGDSALIEADDNSGVPNGDAVCDGFCLGGGNDTAYIRDPGGNPANTNFIEVFGEDGDDTIIDHTQRTAADVSGDTGNELQGGNGNDVLIGDAAETLVGGAGNDLLAGGQGTDSLNGGDGNDILVGGPGRDTYTSAANDGDDIVIIQAGDVPAGNNNESYTCRGNDTILLFGFNQDGVVTLTGGGTKTITDPVNNPTGDASGARYTFIGTDTCTIIFVE